MAVNTVSFNKRIPPGAGSRGTLAEMVARAKAAAEAKNTAMTTIETPTIMQGVGKLAQTLGAGLQERMAMRDESRGREELARIKAGIGLEGATPEQLAQVGIYDTELEKQYREEAVQARRDKAARDQANLEREDEQGFRAGESLAERNARKEAEAAQNAITLRGQDIDVAQGKETVATTRRGQDIDVAQGEATLAEQVRSGKAGEAHQTATLAETTAHNAATLKTQQDQLAAEKDKPVGDVAQLMDATERFARGDWGDPKDPRNQAIFQAGVQKNTAFAKGMRISFDEDGRPVIEQGGMEGGVGGVMDTAAGQKARVASIDEYRADAKAANSALPGVQSAGKVVKSAGYTGPFQGVYGTIDDMLEAGGSMLGLEPGKSSIMGIGTSLPGTATARDIISKGSLDQVLARVQETKGAISNAEMETFRKAAFGLEKTPESNEMLANMAMAIIARANERAARAEKWFETHNQNMAGFEDQEWQPYINANPLIGTDPDTGIPILMKQGGPRAENAPAATEAPAQTFKERPVNDWDDDELAAGRQLR